MFACAEDVLTPNAVAPTKTFELSEYTDRFRSVSYAIRLDFGKKKSLSHKFFAALTIVAAEADSLKQPAVVMI